MQKIERMKEMPEIKREIFKMVFNDTLNIPNDETWRKYSRDFTHEGKEYTVKLSFMKSGQYFTYRNYELSYKQQIIGVGDVLKNINPSQSMRKH